jgi:hypothetical protein
MSMFIISGPYVLSSFNSYFFIIIDGSLFKLDKLILVMALALHKNIQLHFEQNKNIQLQLSRENGNLFQE